MKRQIFRVMFDKRLQLLYEGVLIKEGLWCIVHEGSRLMTSEKKAGAVNAARGLAKSHKKSQVVICGKNGRIQKEFTYGADPRRYKG